MLSMEKINIDKLTVLKNRLQKQFDYTYNLDDTKSFFIGIGDYLSIIDNSDYLVAIITASILSDKNNLTNEINEITNKSVEETKTTYAKIQKIIKDKKIDNSVVQNAIKEYKMFLDGDIKKSGSGNFATYLIESVRNILLALKDNGYEKISDDFAVLDQNKIIIDWKISSSEKEVDKALAKLKEQQNISIWGAWDELVLCFISIYEKDKVWEDAVTHNDILKRFNLSGPFSEMNEIMEGKTQDQNRHHFFEITKFKRHIQRVQNKVNSEIEDIITTNKEKTFNQRKESNFRYDAEGTMLFYKDNLILNMHKNSSGRSKIFNSFWEGKKLVIDGVIIEKGKPAILRAELCKISGYSSNENIDKAVKFFRGKIKDLPAEIVAEKGFRLIITD